MSNGVVGIEFFRICPNYFSESILIGAAEDDLPQISESEVRQLPKMARAVLERQQNDTKEQRRRINTWNHAIQDLLGQGDEETNAASPAERADDAELVNSLSSPESSKVVPVKGHQGTDGRSSGRGGNPSPVEPNATSRSVYGGPHKRKAVDLADLSNFNDMGDQHRPTDPVHADATQRIDGDCSAKGRHNIIDGAQQTSTKRTRVAAKCDGYLDQDVHSKDQQQNSNGMRGKLQARTRQQRGKELPNPVLSIEKDDSDSEVQDEFMPHDDEYFVASIAGNAASDISANYAVKSLADCLAEVDDVLNELWVPTLVLPF